MPSESLNEDRLANFLESEASLIAKQARSECLDRVAAYCELERGDSEEQRWVMGMQRPQYHNPSRATINLTFTSSLKLPADGTSYYARRFPKPRP